MPKVPGVQGKVPRATNVVVQAQDRNQEDVVIEAEGLLAIALQHELDHLDGILFVDKAVEILTDDEEMGESS